jgi:hypothetical protein
MTIRAKLCKAHNRSGVVCLHGPWGLTSLHGPFATETFQSNFEQAWGPQMVHNLLHPFRFIVVKGKRTNNHSHLSIRSAVLPFMTGLLRLQKTSCSQACLNHSLNVFSALQPLCPITGSDEGGIKAGADLCCAESRAKAVFTSDMILTLAILPRGSED